MNQDNKNCRVSYNFILIFVIIPMLLGGMVYITFRSDSLLMFRWFDFLGLTSLVKDMRDLFGFLIYYLPDWVIFSFPDGVWVFSLTAFMAGIWRNGPKSSRLIWCSIGPLIGIGGEVAQYFSFIKGTFDIDDLAINLIASVSAFYLVKISHGGYSNNEN